MISRIKFASITPEVYVQRDKMTRMCSVSRIFQTNCKLFVCAKEKTRNKRDILPSLPQNLVEQSSGNNLLNSRIRLHQLEI